MKTVPFGLFIFGLIMIFLGGACGKANSSMKRAEIIPAPTSGVTCYAIIDDDGKTVGGNCIKD